jgi:hypothetical protein
MSSVTRLPISRTSMMTANLRSAKSGTRKTCPPCDDLIDGGAQYLSLYLYTTQIIHYDRNAITYHRIKAPDWHFP